VLAQDRARQRALALGRVGARARGSAPDGPGFWFAPTVLAPVDPGSRVAREEIFGPSLP
jgi:acyl-CoA reductase-like NAD-dependent aldehyde dehydrogenase